MDSASVGNFDLNGEAPNNYFKSSFARSMAFTNTVQSKSLDYVFMDENSTIKEESDPCKNQKPAFDVMSIPRKPRRSVPSLPTYDPAFPREYSASVRLKTRGNDALKFWKMKQEAAVKKPNSACSIDDALLQEESKDEEILRLRKVFKSGLLCCHNYQRQEFLQSFLGCNPNGIRGENKSDPSWRPDNEEFYDQKGFTQLEKNPCVKEDLYKKQYGFVLPVHPDFMPREAEEVREDRILKVGPLWMPPHNLYSYFQSAHGELRTRGLWEDMRPEMLGCPWAIYYPQPTSSIPSQAYYPQSTLIPCMSRLPFEITKTGPTYLGHRSAHLPPLP